MKLLEDGQSKGLILYAGQNLVMNGGNGGLCSRCTTLLNGVILMFTPKNDQLSQHHRIEPLISSQYSFIQPHCSLVLISSCAIH